MSEQSYIAIQVVMMPRDTNPHGTIFGGVVLSYIDQAGVIGARREIQRAGGPIPLLVTVAINRSLSILMPTCRGCATARDSRC